MNVSAPSAPLTSFHPRLIHLAALLCLACVALSAPPARQVPVFPYLYTYVDRIKLNRDYRGPYTPGETRVMTAYRLAGYQISQDYAKTHTPAAAAAFERLHGQYEMNSGF